MSFDNDTFEQLMAEGMQAHREAEYARALFCRERAHDLAPPDSLEAGRAARDMAASYDRLGESEGAEYHAEDAFRIHNRLVQNGNKAAQRELAASAMYAGVVIIRPLIFRELDKKEFQPETAAKALQYAAKARETMEQHKHQNDGKIDQYWINMAARLSIITSVARGNKDVSHELAQEARRLAPLSEMPIVMNSDPAMTEETRKQAQLRAGRRATIAQWVAWLAPSRMNSLPRNFALKIGEKVL